MKDITEVDGRQVIFKQDGNNAISWTDTFLKFLGIEIEEKYLTEHELYK